MQLELSLVEAGIVSSDDLVEALSRREDERPPLGQIAIEEGLLGVRQVLDIIRAQRVARPGTLFGQLAIEKGMLTDGEVARLLMLQQQRQRPVIEHLVELGRVSYEEAAAAARSRASRRLETGLVPALSGIGL